MTKLLIGMALIWCAGSVFAGGAGTRLILTSEALEKEIMLWCATCPPERHEREEGECANDKRTLVKRLLEFARYCDEVSASFQGAVGTPEELKEMHAVDAAWKLQARAARFRAKFQGAWSGNPCLTCYQEDAPAKAEALAIANERERILKENPDIKFAQVGLLSDEWLSAPR